MASLFPTVALLVVLLTVIVDVEPSKPSPMVENLSTGWGPEQVKQYSGYIAVNQEGNNGAHIFFWMFESRSRPSSDPLVLWMTGGPGCSSELAVFFEQGPYRVTDGSVVLNPHAWNNIANVIFIDQPVGTGFSYADSESEYVKDEKQVGADMYEFMQKFYMQFPQYQVNDFIVTGESYAGHYVPAVSNAIFQGNKVTEGFKIPLKAFAIGNGMVNAKLQYPEYITYAEENQLITSPTSHTIVAGETKLCELCINKPLLAMSVCNAIITTVQKVGGNFNVYDIRKRCEHPPLCYDFSALDKLMKDPDILNSLGVNRQKAKWEECDQKVHAYLMDDWFTDCGQYLPDMLDAGIKGLIYHGTSDFICNFEGGLAWANNLKWNGQQSFNTSFSDWMVDGRTVGSMKTRDNFTFLKVYNAGHMVPMDQPAVALQMLQQFVVDAKSSVSSGHGLLNLDDYSPLSFIE